MSERSERIIGAVPKADKCAIVSAPGTLPQATMVHE